MLHIIKNLFYQMFEDIHWFNFLRYDEYHDGRISFLLYYTKFLYYANAKEIAEFKELKKEHGSSGALHIMYNRLSYRYKEQKQKEEDQRCKMRREFADHYYSPALYKQEQERWSKRNLSQEDMNNRRFGGGKKYSINERIQEPIIKWVNYNKYIYYVIHDKVNQVYTVEIFDIIHENPTVRTYTDLSVIKFDLQIFLHNLSNEIESTLELHRKNEERRAKIEEESKDLKRVLQEQRKWQKHQDFYQPYYDIVNPDKLSSKKNNRRKIDNSISHVQAALQQNQQSTIDSNLFSDDIF